mgnify:CR=1 FL=1
MAARTRKRPVRKIGRKMKTKLFALFMLIVVAMLGLIGRLMFIEYTSGAPRGCLFLRFYRHRARESGQHE